MAMHVAMARLGTPFAPVVRAGRCARGVEFAAPKSLTIAEHAPRKKRRTEGRAILAGPCAAWGDPTMKVTNQRSVLLCAGFVLSICSLGPGCYNASEVKAFLQKPRSPVSGVQYRVLPPDIISITSTYVPEINGVQARIRPDGRINLPLLGEFFVASKTPKEIEADLVKAAKKYYREADATVQVVAFSSRRFYVFGQVVRPGAVPWTGCDTLLDVLAVAQPTDLAWPERIIVIRGAGPTQGGHVRRPSLKYSVLGVNEFGQSDDRARAPGKDDDQSKAKDEQDNQRKEGNKGKEERPARDEAAVENADSVPHRLTINLMAMVEHGDMANNILLRPNDIVYVQAHPFAKVALAIEQIMSPVRAATDGLSDYREFMSHYRWIEAGQPSEEDRGRARIIAR